jgi:drug/metabolite transporter (DMT)-like permease
MAAMLPGERLRVHHLLGVAAGLAGAGLIITRGFASGIAEGFQPGHGLALAAAFVWSGYSVLTRRFPAVPTDVVAGYCLATALLTLGLHLALEETVWPATGGAWAAVAALGLLPRGLAFYAWDHGCKHGDIMVLGALSYLAPPVSVIILVASGHAAFHWSIAAGCLLVVAGALVASRDMLRRPAPAEGSPA